MNHTSSIDQDELFLIDTHTHIDGDEFIEDFEEMVERSKRAGLGKIVVPAIEPNRFDRLKQITEKFDIIFQGIGIHPHSADKFDESVAERIREEIKREKVVAIGEIGLEYYYDFVDKDTQKSVFAWHLDLAAETGLPALIHSRDAERECIEMFRAARERNPEGNLNGVLHCFSENPDIMKEAVEAGLMVSFTGNITFKKFSNLESVEQVPLDKFMIETDAPYMAPVPHRGKRNEPALVGEVAKKIAEVKKMKVEDIVRHTTENALRFFKLAMLALVAVIGSGTVYADDRYDGYEDDEDVSDWSTPKSFGIGFIAGTNTIIDELSYTTNENFKNPGETGTSSRSADGLFALGLNLNYFFNKYMMVELSFNNSSRDDIANFPGIEPYEYNIYMGQLYFILNPDNAVNFFISAGGGTINSIEYYPKSEEERNTIIEANKFNPLVGASFGVGYDLETDFGIFNINASFQFMGMTNEIAKTDYIVHEGERGLIIDIPTTRLFSLPRFNLTYYPALF
jgi:TatD DNase family protein